MGFARFYGHFAAAYGTLWLLLFLAALLSQSHIDAGEFGFFGFPILAIFYAVLRVMGAGGKSSEVAELRERVAHLETQQGTRL